MNAGVVGWEGWQPAVDRGGKADEFAQHAVMSEGGSSAAREHGHLLPIEGAAPDIAFYLAAARQRHAPHQPLIGAADATCREARRQSRMRLLALRHDHQAGRIL